MKKICVFPGSFNPITSGHMNIIEKASALFDEVIVAVTDNKSKSYRVKAAERAEIARKAVAAYLNVKVEAFNGLTAEFCVNSGAAYIVRGIRTYQDFENEKMLMTVNKKLKNIETLFFITDSEYAHISSSMVREILDNGGSIKDIVPLSVAGEIKLLYSKK